MTADMPACHHRSGWWQDAGFYLLAMLVVLADQATKHIAVARLSEGMSIPFLGPVASLTLAHNQGSAMGLLPGSSGFLSVVGVIVVLALIFFGPRFSRISHSMWWGLGLLLGGACGNLIDRIHLGYVVDFIDFHWWPVFNLADIAVVCGAVLTAFAVTTNRSGVAAPDKE